MPGDEKTEESKKKKKKKHSSPKWTCACLSRCFQASSYRRNVSWGRTDAIPSIPDLWAVPLHSVSDYPHTLSSPNYTALGAATEEPKMALSSCHVWIKLMCFSLHREWPLASTSQLMTTTNINKSCRFQKVHLLLPVSAILPHTFARRHHILTRSVCALQIHHSSNTGRRVQILYRDANLRKEAHASQ